MSYTSVDQQRGEAIAATLRENPRFKDATIKVKPINGSGDYAFTLTGKTKLKEPRTMSGVVKSNEDIEHLKRII